MDSEPELKTKDVARAAALLVEAVANAPSRQLSGSTVSTPRGPVDVVLDDAGADVILRAQGRTVHVRRQTAKNEN